MGRLLEELDYRPTAMGPLVLRRRWVAAIDTDVVEVILGDEHLMSSLFTVGETELAVRGLASASGTDLRVLVGGLGLGYTAREALADPRVASVEVIDALAPVIEWHQAGLVPLGESLGRESRCRLVLGDFFGWFETRRPADAAYDVVLLDIDHSPPQSAPPGPRPLLFAGGSGPSAAGAGGERGIRHVVRRGPGPRLSRSPGIGLPGRPRGRRRLRQSPHRRIVDLHHLSGGIDAEGNGGCDRD